MADEAARREQERRFAEARQAERGDYDSDRGDYDSDRGDYDSDRGDYDSDRGDYDASRVSSAGAGDANRALADIFRKTVGLGGHLVVAFVAPIGASSAGPPRFRRGASPSQSEAAAASAHVAELIDQIRENRARRSEQRPPKQKPGSDIRAATQSSASAPATPPPARPPTGQ